MCCCCSPNPDGDPDQIQAAARNGARHIAQGEATGTLEPGKLAGLSAESGNQPEDMTATCRCQRVVSPESPGPALALCPTRRTPRNQTSPSLSQPSPVPRWKILSVASTSPAGIESICASFT